jgi:hypothetical protein
MGRSPNSRNCRGYFLQRSNPAAREHHCGAISTERKSRSFTDAAAGTCDPHYLFRFFRHSHPRYPTNLSQHPKAAFWSRTRLLITWRFKTILGELLNAIWSPALRNSVTAEM